MKTIIFATTIALLTSTSAFAGKTHGCNPAIQNWVSGSKTTCVFDSTNDRVFISNPSIQNVPSAEPPVETGTPSENDNNVLK